jgi:hypothetical protein
MAKKGRDPREEGVRIGIGETVKRNKRLSGFESYLLQNVDPAKIDPVYINSLNEAKALGMSPEETYKHIVSNVADYVSQGDAFDEKSCVRGTSWKFASKSKK